MTAYRVAILGATGIGKYHAREFKRCGCSVDAVLGSSEQSVVRTCERLAAEFGIVARGYVDLSVLLAKERPDIVVVSTPAELHEDHVRASLAADAHVFCEKPFVVGPLALARAESLVSLAKEQELILSINTQWVEFTSYVPATHLEEFFMYMEPGKKGKAILEEMVPHANSILLRALPGGRIQDIHFRERRENAADVSFLYVAPSGNCHVRYHFVHKADRPRKMIVGINGREWAREMGRNYEQILVSGTDRRAIEDPFAISVARFVGAVKGVGACLVTEREILDNIALQVAILAAYDAE